MAAKSILANPLNYPLAVLIGALVWVGGARSGKIDWRLALLGGGAIAVAAAVVRQRQDANRDRAAVERELRSARDQAELFASRAQELHQAATERLGASGQMRLLAAVQFACDRARELPDRLVALSEQLLNGQDSLFSLPELQRQLEAAKAKRRNARGVAEERLRDLVESLENNIRLVEQGRNARQAQAIALTTLVVDSMATLQDLQNRLQAADLDNETTVQRLQDLADKLGALQENVDLLVSHDC